MKSSREASHQRQPPSPLALPLRKRHAALTLRSAVTIDDFSLQPRTLQAAPENEGAIQGRPGDHAAQLRRLLGPDLPDGLMDRTRPPGAPGTAQKLLVTEVANRR